MKPSRTTGFYTSVVGDEACGCQPSFHFHLMEVRRKRECSRGTLRSKGRAAKPIFTE